MGVLFVFDVSKLHRQHFKSTPQQQEQAMSTNELLKKLQAKKKRPLDAGGCGPVKTRLPNKPRQPDSSALVDLLRRQQERIAAEKAQTVGGVTASPPVSSLADFLPSEDDSKEISLGTVASLSAAVEVCSGPATASAAVLPDALQGVPLSDQEREDRAAGLTLEQAKHAAEACVDTLEWLLGLETLTQEQAELVASFRRMDAALISSRGNKPYLDILGIPRLPPDCEPKYRHWAGGQPLLDTLLELGASDRAIDMRVTMERSPDDWRRWQEIKAQRRK